MGNIYQLHTYYSTGFTTIQILYNIADVTCVLNGKYVLKVIVRMLNDLKRKMITFIIITLYSFSKCSQGKTLFLISEITFDFLVALLVASLVALLIPVTTNFLINSNSKLCQRRVLIYSGTNHTISIDSDLLLFICSRLLYLNISQVFFKIMIKCYIK